MKEYKLIGKQCYSEIEKEMNEAAKQAFKFESIASSERWTVVVMSRELPHFEDIKTK
jgi:hypothetical protein